MPVQRARHQLLARAGFTCDQHGHAGARQPADRAEDLLHGRGLAEQLRNAASRRVDIDRDGGLLRGAADQVHGLVDVEGLGQVLEGAALIGRDGGIEVGVRRHDDHRQAGARHLDFLEQIEAAAAGHADVGHQHVGSVGAQRRNHVVGLVEGLGDHAAALQRLFQNPANGCIVVDQPDLKRFRAHTVSMGREMTKMVLPGALSNSIRPPWRLTRSCAMPSPRPVPSARPETRG